MYRETLLPLVNKKDSLALSSCASTMLTHDKEAPSFGRVLLSRCFPDPRRISALRSLLFCAQLFIGVAMLFVINQWVVDLLTLCWPSTNTRVAYTSVVIVLSGMVLYGSIHAWSWISANQEALMVMRGITVPPPSFDFTMKKEEAHVMNMLSGSFNVTPNSANTPSAPPVQPPVISTSSAPVAIAVEGRASSRSSLAPSPGPIESDSARRRRLTNQKLKDISIICATNKQWATVV